MTPGKRNIAGLIDPFVLIFFDFMIFIDLDSSPFIPLLLILTNIKYTTN